jgi:hypothetical protein
MAASYETNLDGVSSTGDGATITLPMVHADPDLPRAKMNGAGLGRTLWHIEGITDATVAIEGSVDGTNWISITTTTSDDIIEVIACPHMRANVTVYTGGTISVWVFIGG